jgi:hypothetical protein
METPMRLEGGIGITKLSGRRATRIRLKQVEVVIILLSNYNHHNGSQTIHIRDAVKTSDHCSRRSSQLHCWN